MSTVSEAKVSFFDDMLVRVEHQALCDGRKYAILQLSDPDIPQINISLFLEPAGAERLMNACAEIPGTEPSAVFYAAVDLARERCGLPPRKVVA